MTTTAPPPGTRIVVRDAEWVVGRVDALPDGGAQLTCTGVSELVREREAVFLTRLEDGIKVLDPATTTLMPDRSPRFTRSLLYTESLLRRAVPNDERIRVARGAAMDEVPYQFDPARQAASDVASEGINLHHQATGLSTSTYPGRSWSSRSATDGSTATASGAIRRSSICWPRAPTPPFGATRAFWRC